MTTEGPWTTENYENMSWHDAHVHGLRLDTFRDDEGAADLVIDLDFILQWHQAGAAFEFTLAPATLRFHEVFGLRISLDYAASSAGMCPFAINDIERELVTFPTGYTSYKWRIPIRWPGGEIEFQSPGFTQVLTGKPRFEPRPMA